MHENPHDIVENNGNFKAKSYSKAELESKNFGLCGFMSEEEILKPFELIKQIKHERQRLNSALDSLINQFLLSKENE